MSGIILRSVLFLYLLELSSARQKTGLTVTRLNSGENNRQYIKEQRDRRFQLLWGETEDAEDWDKFESFRRFLGSSHSYSHDSSSPDGHGHGYDRPPIHITDFPTRVEFKFPTASPVDDTTDAPTSTPSVSPTSRPTAEPTPVPTVEPTPVPTVEPSTAPTQEPVPPSSIRSCYTNPSTGEPEFGDVKTSKLNFAYIADLTEQTTSFIPLLEEKMLDSVADVFLNCGGDGGGKNLQIDYESPIVAIDSKPKDKPLPSGKSFLRYVL
mmetsp:Transcript_48566/g.58805  ORF Transcript_48566/g.58805 Transcript_48566/m.58805 type:complete len:266 (-) Transcript_48566:279-1076(-)